MKFILMMLFVYVPAMIFYLFAGVVVIAYLKKQGYLDKFFKNKKSPNDLEVKENEEE